MSVTRHEVVRIDAKIAWLVAYDPATGTYVGICPPLNLNASGETFSELQQSANEAMELLLQDLFEDGELAEFLSRHGWRASEMPAYGTVPRFDVPVDLVLQEMQEVVHARA